MKNNILKYLIITIFICVTIYYDEEIALCADMRYECEDTNDYLMSEAQKYVVENAERHVETFIKLSAAGYAMLDTEGTYYLGRGYYTFTLEENKISRGEIINFQVIQYDRIVLILQIYKKDDEWHCNATTGGVDLLNEYGYITSIPCVVYAPDGKYLVDDGEVISFEEHNICTEVFTSDQMAELHYNYIKSRGSVLNKADYMCELGKIGLSPEEYEINSASSVEGFSIYTDTYKLLQMEDRMVSQRWYDGQQKELCWAATAATIIRYMTQTSNIWAYTIAMELGISPDNGGTMDDIYDAMMRHMNKTQMDNYQVLDRNADSITEIYHNINNRFPIAMGTVDTTFNSNLGHAVTLIGYDGKILIYWDSQTEEIMTTEYTGARTFIVVTVRAKNQKTGKYEMQERLFRWVSSIMIPLN